MRLILAAFMAAMMSLQSAVAQRLVSPPQAPSPPLAPAAPLQPPFPGAREETQSPDNKSGGSQQPATSEQRGTDDRPAVVKILPTEKTADERSREENDRADKASTDWWFRVLTGALVMVGVLQFWALIGQAIVFGIQARRLRDSIDLTRNIADRQERDTRDSIAEAARSASAMRDAADAALAQVRTMIAMEQPFFSWIGFRLEPAQPGIVVSGIMPDRDYRPVAIVRNIGRAPMQLRSFCIETMVAQEMLPWGSGRISVSGFGPIPEYSDIINVGYAVEAGKDAHLVRPKALRFTAQETDEIQSLERQFWIYGFVSYLNQFTGETWEAGFSALWQGDRFSYFPTPNYDYHRRREASGDTAKAT